jgi:hypothetical protein
VSEQGDCPRCGSKLCRGCGSGESFQREQHERKGEVDVARLTRERDEYRDALDAIASEDFLVKANPDAFSGHAFARVQFVARAVLDRYKEK